MGSKPRCVALMLDLEWLYKRHVGIFAGSQLYAEERGWESTIDEFVHDSLKARSTKSVPYDGIIARATKRLAEQARRANVPLVNVWLSSPVCSMLPGVFADYSAAGCLRAEHLLTRGLRNFAALISRGDRSHALEMKAFCSTLGKAGYSCATAKVPLHVSRTLAGWRATKQVLADSMDHWKLPVGVYVGAEAVGRVVAQTCRRRGWRVPEDVAIITGSNEETICEHPRPSLTSVEMGYERIGYEAAQLLDRLMDGEAPPPEHLLLPPVGLVVRESTDFFAVDDEIMAAALAFIAANSHRRIRADDVAHAVVAETRTLQLRFRKYLGRPIATEIRRVRIERAKREITQSKRPLGKIAHDVGFGGAKRMYAVFCREVGVTPSEYRQRRQSQGEN